MHVAILILLIPFFIAMVLYYLAYYVVQSDRIASLMTDFSLMILTLELLWLIAAMS